MQFEGFVWRRNSIMRSSEVSASAMLSESKKYECEGDIKLHISWMKFCANGKMLVDMLNSIKKKNPVI
jgi:hypothetical protein